jgi:hypothetical protein
LNGTLPEYFRLISRLEEVRDGKGNVSRGVTTPMCLCTKVYI